jgi:hypothetical protein
LAPSYLLREETKKKRHSSDEEGPLDMFFKPTSPKKVCTTPTRTSSPFKLKKAKKPIVNLVSPEQWIEAKKKKKEENSISPYFPPVVEDPNKEKKQSKLFFHNSEAQKPKPGNTLIFPHNLHKSATRTTKTRSNQATDSRTRKTNKT